MKFTRTSRVHPSQSSDYFPTKSVSLSNIIFPPLRETLYASHVKFFDEMSERFSHAALQLAVVRKTASSEIILPGVGEGNQKVLNRNCKGG